jgi:uncharacterized protein YndB with AHSA1/START domain
MGTRVIFGRLRMGPGGSAVRFEWRFDVAQAEVWAAVTEPERVARWLAPISGVFEVAGEVRVDFGGGAAASVLIRECRPGRGLLLEWVFPDGLSTPLRLELRCDGDTTVLALDHSNFPASPAEYAAAWQVNLDQLAAELAGRAPTGDYGSEFEQLVPHYRAAWDRLVNV